MRFSINCSTVICSPTVAFAILREATSKTYGPRVYLPSYYQLAISITVYLSISDLTFASNREGIDNPFIALGASLLIVCAGIR